ncbi:MAG: group II intron reverse transcriptase/maturase [Proteobacteria bacterium]|nr:group II intron reverse transcriptase/maturase [Pseudomonadota bacterium]
MPSANVTVKTSNNVNPIIWHTIDWRSVHKKVNNLRKRIYRASANGNMKLAGNLQKLMLKSNANKLLAIRRVTLVNQGKSTPGIDKVVVNTDRGREELVQKLVKIIPSSVQPIRRVYIPKKGGKARPLGLPTILDRCKQAIVKSALEPFWEAKFEGCSYGFRLGRSPHDAIQKLFCIVRPGKTRRWVLDADIEGAFDNISHDFLVKAIGNFPGRHWIFAWLKSGVMESCKFTVTTAGTPQGGIISPLLANIALHGIEDVLNITYDKHGRLNQKSEYALVRYADDFVICAKTEESCTKAKEIIGNWLNIRGLKLSENKTKILSIKQGFDFLGFNIRQYKTESKRRGITVLIRPSKDSIKSFKKSMILEWKKSVAWSLDRVIENLNPKIKGWCSYFNKTASKRTFAMLDNWMWIRQAKFVRRRHPKKHWWWLKPKYWGGIKGRNDKWVFMDKSKHRDLYLWKPGWTEIKRHVLVFGKASPDNPELQSYWQKRQTYNKKYLFKTRQIIWRKQEGKCPVCMDVIDNGEKIHLHHKLPRKSGGTDHINNLALLHTNCHIQVHSKQGQQIAAVSKLLEPYAG